MVIPAYPISVIVRIYSGHVRKLNLIHWILCICFSNQGFQYFVIYRYVMYTIMHCSSQVEVLPDLNRDHGFCAIIIHLTCFKLFMFICSPIISKLCIQRLYFLKRFFLGHAQYNTIAYSIAWLLRLTCAIAEVDPGIVWCPYPGVYEWHHSLLQKF